MSKKKHEDWTVAALAVASPESELEQEWSVPRGARRIDIVHRWAQAPEHFGVLRPWLSHRAVLVEHESSHFGRRKWWSFRIAPSWLRAIWFGDFSQDERRIRERIGPTPEVRAPVLLVVAEGMSMLVRTEATGLRELDTPGIWVDGTPDNFTTIVIDGARLKPGPGSALWYFLLGPGPDSRYDVLTALTLDPSISMEMIEKLKLAIADETIPTTEPSRRTLLDELREEGRRESLLLVARKVAPAELDRLKSISGLDELQSAVFELLDR